ncbi:MAG: hypothetical protein JNJ58_08455 [Chitinophagaceae bacterium]|nr:hypothetical protein [Chitinophagaceae bacterium]
MIQYLVHSSVIWLSSLLIFEMIFRKESFHQYNRMYLWVSLLAGLFIPLMRFNPEMITNQQVYLQPVKQIFIVKGSVQENPIREMISQTGSMEYSPEEFLWMIYLIGVLAGIIILIREVLMLIRLYRAGSKTSENGCVIIETGKEHGPFSFLNFIFVGHRSSYTSDQWAFLMTHEMEHGRQFHSVDNIVLLVLRIAFWFNPFIHIYYKRLRIVHEFQADVAANSNTIEYGTFLLEQNMLQGAPMLTHTINYSPLKTRMIMLTKNQSARIKLLKYLSVVPLFLILTICCTQSSFSGVSSEKKKSIKFKGNEIEFGSIQVIPWAYRETMKQKKAMFLSIESLPDSVAVKDPSTGFMNNHAVLRDTMPVALNGVRIYGNEDLYVLPTDLTRYDNPVFIGEKDLETYLFAQLKNELEKLEDGAYLFQINRMVIDAQGQVAYFENPGIGLNVGPDEPKPYISKELKQAIDAKTTELFNASIQFKPALKNGKPINVRLGLGNYQIIVKDHQAKLADRGGC